jgi:hypothetical protein
MFTKKKRKKKKSEREKKEGRKADVFIRFEKWQITVISIALHACEFEQASEF